MTEFIVNYTDLPPVEVLAVDPSDPQTLYFGTWGVFKKSTDGGGSWASVNDGLLSDTHALALAVDPSDPQTLYAGTFGLDSGEGGVFKSTDGGDRWIPINDGLPDFMDVYSLVVDPSTSQTLYAVIGKEVFSITWETPTLVHTPAELQQTETAIPPAYSLAQNYPNPFNSGTVIRFALPQAQSENLSVYNLAGQRVVTLANGQRPAGTYTVRWDGRDESGRALASGVYLYCLQAGTQMQTRKLVLLR